MTHDEFPFRCFEPQADFKVVERKLPHWSQIGTICFITFRTNDSIPKAMVGAFERDPARHLGERLLDALSAGLEAGGETAPVRSAGLFVVDRFVWPVIDLRVDWHDEPIGELKALFSEYFPQMNDYIQRAVDPTQAPGYK